MKRETIIKITNKTTGLWDNWAASVVIFNEHYLNIVCTGKAHSFAYDEYEYEFINEHLDW